MNKYLIISIICIMLSPLLARSISCDYDTEPYLTGEIDWLCEVNEDSKCYGVITGLGVNGSEDNQSIISVSPQYRYIPVVGMVDYFESQGIYVNIKFSTEDLLEGISYNFTTYCVSGRNMENLSVNITPAYGELRLVPHWWIFAIENMPYIFLILLILAVVVFFIKQGRK